MKTSMDSFITDFYCLAEYCELGTLKDDLIRVRIVFGLRDRKLSEQLQLHSQLTLETAVTKARQSETVKKQYSMPINVNHLSKGKVKVKDAKEHPNQRRQPQKSADQCNVFQMPSPFVP